MARKSSRRRNSRHLRRNTKTSMMTYGVVPSQADFLKHLDTARDEEGEPVWNDEEGYSMVLAGSDVKQAARALRRLKKFEGDTWGHFGHHRSSIEQFEDHHGKYGLRFLHKNALWRFIKALPILTNDPDGDLASTIMTTLGYEWV